MPMSRVFSKNEKGEDVLICAIDLDTEEVTYYVSQEELAKRRERIMKKVSLVASDMAKRDPTAALFHLNNKA